MSLVGPKKKDAEKSTPSEDANDDQSDDDLQSKKSENDYTSKIVMNDTSKIVILNGGDFQDTEKSRLWAQTMRTQHPTAEEIHTTRMTESAKSDLDILVLRNVIQLELRGMSTFWQKWGWEHHATAAEILFPCISASKKSTATDSMSVSNQVTEAVKKLAGKLVNTPVTINEHGNVEVDAIIYGMVSLEQRYYRDALNRKAIDTLGEKFLCDSVMKNLRGMNQTRATFLHNALKAKFAGRHIVDPKTGENRLCETPHTLEEILTEYVVEMVKIPQQYDHLTKVWGFKLASHRKDGGYTLSEKLERERKERERRERPKNERERKVQKRKLPDQETGKTGKVHRTDDPCKFCGRTHKHPKGGEEVYCPFAHSKHPDRNLSGAHFAKSEMGLKWAKITWPREDRAPAGTMVWGKKLNGEDFPMESRKKVNLNTLISSLTTRKKQKIIHVDINLSNHSNRAEEAQPGLSVEVKKYLIDTGAIDSDYISTRLIERIKKIIEPDIKKSDITVSSTLAKQKPIHTMGRIDLHVIIFNERTQKRETIFIEGALIIDSAPYDIIFGLPTIRKYDLTTICHNQMLWDQYDDPTITQKETATLTSSPFGTEGGQAEEVGPKPTQTVTEKDNTFIVKVPKKRHNEVLEKHEQVSDLNLKKDTSRQAKKAKCEGNNGNLSPLGKEGQEKMEHHESTPNPTLKNGDEEHDAPQGRRSNSRKNKKAPAKIAQRKAKVCRARGAEDKTSEEDDSRQTGTNDMPLTSSLTENVTAKTTHRNDETEAERILQRVQEDLRTYGFSLDNKEMLTRAALREEIKRHDSLKQRQLQKGDTIAATRVVLRQAALKSGGGYLNTARAMREASLWQEAQTRPFTDNFQATSDRICAMKTKEPDIRCYGCQGSIDTKNNATPSNSPIANRKVDRRQPKVPSVCKGCFRERSIHHNNTEEVSGSESENDSENESREARQSYDSNVVDHLLNFITTNTSSDENLVDSHRLCAMKTKDIRRKDNIKVEPLPHVKTNTIVSGRDLIPILPHEQPTHMEELTPTPTYESEKEAEANEEYKDVHISGSPDLQRRLRKVVYENRRIFSTKLPEQPARVTPMEFEIDQTLWNVPSNRFRYRKQSVVKDNEIGRQVEVMLENGIIIRSDSTEWSQVLLTPKPNMKWRFCIDFRQLNTAMSQKGWPLPRIEEMLRRIGDRKNSIFGKIDMTNGYHQLPLAMGMRKWTAFITSHGLFNWTRVPMGLKNAAPYFQEIMTSEVLNGYVNHICELYMDDCIPYGKTEDEFVQNVSNIFARFKERNIIVSPDKCFLGLEEIEVLGHTLNKEGLSFSREKLQGVCDIPLPETGKKMQSFLGLTNYFREHVKNMTQMERPLRKLSLQYPNNTKIQWTEEGKLQFIELQQAIWNLPTLFFVDTINDSPIYLHTDACDYGIGAYLFQVVDGKERPIGFFSKALHNAELNWSTFEKEAYAIHQALKKFEYLLRDVKFTIRTDHRNLLYLNLDASRKVLNWKLDIQEYNFDVEHIPGVDNVVADIYSRVTFGDQDKHEQIPAYSHFEKSKELGNMKLISTLMARQAQPAPQPTYTERRDPPLDLNVAKAIAAVHNAVVGHTGVEKTLQRLRERATLTWKSMRKDVRKYIRQCPQCQFMRKHRIKINIAPYNVSTYRPMDRINIDTIGPLPEDGDGKRYINVIIDAFSRFIEISAVKDVSAISAAKPLIDFIGRYGCPDEILTDNGTEYCNQLMDQVYSLIDTHHLTILAYSHEENSIVERANREVRRHLNALIFDKRIKHEWSQVLPLVQRIWNAKVHESIGTTPASIVFGNNIDLDRGVLTAHSRLPEGTVMHEYIQKMWTKQEEIIAIAQATQKVIANKHIQDKTKEQEGALTSFPLHSYVKLSPPDDGGMMGADKTSPYFQGPFRVINIHEGNRYTIQGLLDSKQIKTVHLKRLQPFYYDPNIVDPVEVAKCVNQEFVVEDIIQVKGNKDGRGLRYLRTGLEFLIKWEGYDESQNSWEPYSEMKHTEIFKRYCITQNIQYLIPKQYLDEEAEGHMT